MYPPAHGLPIYPTIPTAPTTFTAPTAHREITKAQLQAEDAHHDTNTTYSQIQDAYMPTRQTKKEDIRISNAQVMDHQVKTDLDKITMHHATTLAKIDRLKNDITKLEKKIKSAQKKRTIGWVLLPLSVLGGIATCGAFFAPLYFRNKKREYDSRIRNKEDDILRLTQINSTSIYSNVENLHTRDNDVRGSDEHGDTAYQRQQIQPPVMFIT
jgi:hypothetical protein